MSLEQNLNQGLQHGKTQHREEEVAGEVDWQLKGGIGDVKGQTTYKDVVGRGLVAKRGNEKDQKVAQPLPVPETKRCVNTLEKSNPQLPPLLPAKSKIRVPLRFFPNGNAISEKRKLGARLKISVNELGVRRVSRDIKEIGLAREMWVPKVTVVKHKEVGQTFTKA